MQISRPRKISNMICYKTGSAPEIGFKGFTFFLQDNWNRGQCMVRVKIKHVDQSRKKTVLQCKNNNNNQIRI